MSRRHKSVMSYEFKERLAEELGFANTLRQQGFGGVSARDCGNMVKKAIQMAEQNMAGKQV